MLGDEYVAWLPPLARTQFEQRAAGPADQGPGSS